MSKRKKRHPLGKIVIKFDDLGRMHMDIKTGANAQMIMAIMGLEGFLKSVTGLSTKDIRQLVDEEKTDMEGRIKPKLRPADDFIDVESE